MTTVVEAPIQPLVPSAPKRMLIVVMSLILGLMVGVGLAYIMEYIEHLTPKAFKQTYENKT